MLVVTGATGHSGRLFIQNLEKIDYQGRIRCLVRKNSDADALKKSPLNIEIFYGDLKDEKRY